MHAYLNTVAPQHTHTHTAAAHSKTQLPTHLFSIQTTADFYDKEFTDKLLVCSNLDHLNWKTLFNANPLAPNQIRSN